MRRVALILLDILLSAFVALGPSLMVAWYSLGFGAVTFVLVSIFMYRSLSIERRK